MTADLAPVCSTSLPTPLRGVVHSQEAPLVAALHPAIECVAMARGACLFILPLQQGEGSGGRTVVRRCMSDITCLAWVAVLKNGAPGVPPISSPRRPPPVAAGSGRSGSSGSSTSSSGGSPSEMLEHVALLSGTADGCLQLHDARSGHVRFRQRLHATAAQSLHVRPCLSGLKPDEPLEDLTVCFSDALVRIPALELTTLLRVLALAAARGAGGAHEAVAVPPLGAQRWELPAGVGPRRCGLCMGFKPQDLYALLASGARPGHRQRLCILTGGHRPALAGFEVEEAGQRSTLQLIAGAAASLTSGVWGLARAAGQQGVMGLARSAGSQVGSYGSEIVKQRMRAWLPSSAATVWSMQRRVDDGEAGDDADASEAGPSPEAQAALAASYDDPRQPPTAQPAASWRVLQDDARCVAELVPAPAGPLVAAADGLGRVALLDASTMTLVRLWKGYRDAQCGWVQLPPSHPRAAAGLLLVLLAPSRQTLEVWAARAGQRVASIHMASPCRLLVTQHPFNSWGNTLGERWRAACAPTTYVMDMLTGGVYECAHLINV